ncbi:MAG: hypothetical protein V4669_03285 [Pseudomonadota bacterium]
MTDQLIFTLLTALAVITVASSFFQRGIERAAFLRAQTQKMMQALHSYSDWIEQQRDLPMTERSVDELSSPRPLEVASEVKREAFPSLHTHVVSLLLTHNEITEYLWQQSLLRLSQGSAWCEASEDPVWQRLRLEQEELIEEMIAVCRALSGAADRGWANRANPARTWSRVPLTAQRAQQHQ